MNHLTEIVKPNGEITYIGYNFMLSYEKLVEADNIDCIIVAAEDGFSPLGRGLSYFASELGYSSAEIETLANCIRVEKPDPSIMVLPSRVPGARLKCLVLAASEVCACYEKFAQPLYGKPYRDFYYSVTYEAIAAAIERVEATAIAITHLSASGRFHQDIAKCNIEALAHYLASHPQCGLQKILFTGCCITPEHLSRVENFVAERNWSQHRPILKKIESKDGRYVVSMDILKNEKKIYKLALQRMRESKGDDWGFIYQTPGAINLSCCFFDSFQDFDGIYEDIGLPWSEEKMREIDSSGRDLTLEEFNEWRIRKCLESAINCDESAATVWITPVEIDSEIASYAVFVVNNGCAPEDEPSVWGVFVTVEDALRALGEVAVVRPV
jgi:hypothetical protein